jgi:hypothetical protein
VDGILCFVLLGFWTLFTIWFLEQKTVLQKLDLFLSSGEKDLFSKVHKKDLTSLLCSHTRSTKIRSCQWEIISFTIKVVERSIEMKTQDRK